MWAAAEGNVEVVEALIEAGADFRARLESGFTPFFFAVREGRIEACALLLKAGADVNDTIQPHAPVGGSMAPPPRRDQRLLLAVANAHYELAAFLLDAGADPECRSARATPRCTSITWVRKPGGGDNDPAPEGSGNMTSLEMVRKLVAQGAEPQRPHDEEGRTSG